MLIDSEAALDALIKGYSRTEGVALIVTACATAPQDMNGTDGTAAPAGKPTDTAEYRAEAREGLTALVRRLFDPTAELVSADLFGEGAMLSMTSERLLPIASLDHQLVVTGEILSDGVASALPGLPTENILAEPKAGSKEESRYVDKADYGKRPGYLDAVNAEIEAERQELTELYEEKLIAYDVVREEQMDDAERLALLQQLKAKWAHINKQYINIVSVESRGQKRKKESYEDQMDKLESYIKLLSNPRVNAVYIAAPPGVHRELALEHTARSAAPRRLNDNGVVCSLHSCGDTEACAAYNKELDDVDNCGDCGTTKFSVNHLFSCSCQYSCAAPPPPPADTEAPLLRGRAREVVHLHRPA